MKYKVYIKDTSYAEVEVEAKSEDEALNLAEDMYYNGQIEWIDSEIDYSLD